MQRFALATFAVALVHSSSFATEPAPAPAPIPAPTPTLTPAPVPTPAPAPKPWKGFRLASEDGAHQLRIGGQLQVDAWGFAGDDAKAYVDEVRLRRARLSLRATVGRHYDLRLLIDTADARLQLLDAVIETTFLDELRLRVGKDKSPVSFDRLQSSTALHFLERSTTASVAPNRDLGLQLVGRIANGLVDYQIGLWDGAPDAQTIEQDFDDGFDLAGRLTLQPFVSAELPALKELLIGVSGSWGETTGTQAAPQLGSPRSSGRATWFRYLAGADLATTVIADGARVRIGGHLFWRYGPVSLFGELLQSSQDLRLGDTTGTITNTAYAAQATVLVTGDDASWNGVKPEHAFDPGAGHLGALELAVRWSALDIDDDAFDDGFADPAKSASGSSSLTVGLNWYLDAAVKLQLDYERTTFDGGAADGDRPTEHLVGARTQLIF